MSIEAGKLRHRVRIEELVTVPDSNGDATQDPETGEVLRVWQLVAEVWASIEPLSAREFIAAQSTQSKVSARIVIRQRDGLDAAMRLVHVRLGRPDVIYNIEGILADQESGLEYQTLPVSTGVSTNGQ